MLGLKLALWVGTRVFSSAFKKIPALKMEDGFYLLLENGGKIKYNE